MLESRPEDALVKLVKTVEIVETVETIETVGTVETVETVETVDSTVWVWVWGELRALDQRPAQRNVEK